MIWHLNIAPLGIFSAILRLGPRRRVTVCCGFATAGAEIGRPAYIVASERRGAKLSSHFWAGF
jgi:hypothetical protein